MNHIDLTTLLERGEDSTLEFKREAPHPEALAAEIVAFANTAGGTILFGVEDDGSVCGVADSKLEERLVMICRQNVDPPIIPVITKLKHSELRVLALYIPKNSNVVSTQDGRYYIRIGSTKRQPSKDELARLFQRSRQIQFDETVIEAASMADIDLVCVDTFLQGLKQPALGESKLPLQNLLLNLGVLKSDERGVFPTVAGLLAFGKHTQSFLPGAEIQAAYYRGDSRRSEVLDQKTIRGTMTEQIEAAVSFVKSNMRVGSVIQGLKRVEFPEYSWEAAREAITNAVAHRNYSLAGSGIRLFMFADRLEVLSSGRLPNTLTLESIKVVQFARNQLLASYLAGMGYMEKRGEGILRMIDWSRKNQAPAPKFELPADELFQVTLFKRVSSPQESQA